MHIVRKHFAELDSTNNWVKTYGEELDQEALTLVTASSQTGGRGRFNRKWNSPAGLNIYATYAFFLEVLREDLGNLPQVLALSAAIALQNGGFHPELKWPNDIQISNRKLGGILSETTWVGKKLLVVLGIGLNVNMSLEQLQEIDRPATSLFVESGQEGNVEEWLQKLTDQFSKNLAIFLKNGFRPFLEQYRKLIVHRQRDLLHFHDNQTVWEGKYMGLRDNGALILEVEGEEREFIAGEILP